MPFFSPVVIDVLLPDARAVTTVAILVAFEFLSVLVRLVEVVALVQPLPTTHSGAAPLLDPAVLAPAVAAAVGSAFVGATLNVVPVIIRSAAVFARS